MEDELKKNYKYYANVYVFGAWQYLYFNTFIVDHAACLNVDEPYLNQIGGFTLFAPHAWRYIANNPEYIGDAIKEEG